MYACINVVALGVVDSFVTSDPSLDSHYVVHAPTRGAPADDEISLPLYILSDRSGNGSFHYETATTQYKHRPRGSLDAQLHRLQLHYSYFNDSKSSPN